MRPIFSAVTIFVTIVVWFFGAIEDAHASTPFYGPALYEARGNVKEIKLKTKDRLAYHKKAKFSEDGQINMRMMTYNDQGYPVGYVMPVGNHKIALDIRYNDKNRVDSIGHIVTMISYLKMEVVNLYDEAGQLVGRWARQYEKKDKAPTLYEYEFSDYVNDNQGNWISRQVLQTTINPDSSPKKEEYTETRTIKYYP